jgi:hypothetical protein
MTEAARSSLGADPGWLDHRREQIRSQLRATPAQRLAWLEDAIQLAARAGALPRPPQHRPPQGARKGTVFIAWIDGAYSGYWDALPDDGPAHLEDMPMIFFAAEAIAWAHARTDRVLIRPKSDRGRYYWAGSAPQADDDELPVFVSAPDD